MLDFLFYYSNRQIIASDLSKICLLQCFVDNPPLGMFIFFLLTCYNVLNKNIHRKVQWNYLYIYTLEYSSFLLFYIEGQEIAVMYILGSLLNINFLFMLLFSITNYAVLISIIIIWSSIFHTATYWRNLIAAFLESIIIYFYKNIAKVLSCTELIVLF